MNMAVVTPKPEPPVEKRPDVPDAGDMRVEIIKVKQVIDFHERLADGPNMLKSIYTRSYGAMNCLKAYLKDLEETVEWVDQYADRLRA